VERHAAVVADIRALESELLAPLDAGVRDALLEALARLAVPPLGRRAPS
jgi:hypothetical protein